MAFGAFGTVTYFGGGEELLASSAESEGAIEGGAIPLDPSGGGESLMGPGGGGGIGCGINKKRYTSVRLGYANNGRAVTFAHAESWCAAEGTTCAPATTNQYDIAWAREFRYDGARARYMNRKLDPAALKDFGQLVDLGTVWTDYDGDETYGDFTVFAGEATSTNGYEPGLWRETPVPGDIVDEYLHNDHLGTLRQATGGSGGESPLGVFTAFGEKVTGPSDRFGYVGAHGYQLTLDSGAEVFPFLHLGHRYYDPSSGRFLQRDPIGILGGANVYAYVDATPTDSCDPLGLWRSDNDKDFFKNLEEQRRKQREEEQRQQNIRDRVQSYEQMQGIIDSTKRWQFYLKVPATLVIWLTPQGKILKWVSRTVTACGWGIEWAWDLPNL